MAVVTVEIEVSSSLPAAKLFKVFSDFDTLAPKVEPETYKAVNIIEGDGGVGTIKSITYGDGVPFTSSKHKVDTVDTSNFSLTYTIFEGDVLMGIVESANHHVKFVPSADGGAVYKHTVVFTCKGDNTVPEDTINLMKEGFKKSFKGFEAYAIAHPEAY
uniref:Vegetative storage protein, VSP n=1 Tax=Cichorium intybus TaxID=13427 RepID=Q9LWB1_CICIN|nr:vegetative storage protein, VSP [Cichorium intybus]